MLINIKDAPNYLVQWIDQVIVSKANNIQKFAITFFVLQTKSTLDDKIFTALSMFADKDGNINVDEMLNNANIALDKVNGSLTLPYLNYTVDKDDLNVLYNIIKNSNTSIK